MRFSNAATLFSIASVAQAAPALYPHKNIQSGDLSYGTKYQSGVFYVNWVSSLPKHNLSIPNKVGHLRAPALRHRSTGQQVD